VVEAISGTAFDSKPLSLASIRVPERSYQQSRPTTGSIFYVNAFFTHAMGQSI